MPVQIIDKALFGDSDFRSDFEVLKFVSLNQSVCSSSSYLQNFLYFFHSKNIGVITDVLGHIVSFLLENLFSAKKK